MRAARMHMHGYLLTHTCSRLAVQTHNIYCIRTHTYISAFRTDTGISGNAGPLHERELQKWEAGEGEDALGAGLEEDGTAWSGRGHGTSTKNWDQFEANEKLFGVTVDFDEDQYTTKLDKSSLEYKRRERFAERKAKEIMSGATGNVHVAEERGRMVVDDSQMDEEDRYGAVVRTPGAYVPPHGRRAGTGVAARATTTGVPSTAKAIATGVPSTVKPDTNKKSWAAVSAATANAHVAVATKSPSTASPGKPSSNGANIPAAGPAKPEVKAPSDEKKTVAAVVEKSAPAPSAKKAVTEKPVVTTPAMASSEKKPTGLNVQAASFSFNTGAAAFKPATVGKRGVRMFVIIILQTYYRTHQPDVAQPAVAPPKAKLSTAVCIGCQIVSLKSTQSFAIHSFPPCALERIWQACA